MLYANLFNFSSPAPFSYVPLLLSNFLLFLLLLSSTFTAYSTFSPFFFPFLFRDQSSFQSLPSTFCTWVSFFILKTLFFLIFFVHSHNPLEVFLIETEDMHQLTVLKSHKAKRSCLLSTGYSSKVNYVQPGTFYSVLSQISRVTFDGQSFVYLLLYYFGILLSFNTFSLGASSCSYMV